MLTQKLACSSKSLQKNTTKIRHIRHLECKEFKAICEKQLFPSRPHRHMCVDTSSMAFPCKPAPYPYTV